MMSGYRPWLKCGSAGGKPPWPHIDPAKALPCAERKTWLALAPDQADAGPVGALLEGLGHHRRVGVRQAAGTVCVYLPRVWTTQ